MRVNLEEMRRAVSLAAKVAVKGSKMESLRCVKLAPDPANARRVLVTATDLDLWAELAVQATDANFTTAVPAHFLAELLNYLEGDTVEITFDERLGKLIVQCGKNINVIHCLDAREYPAFIVPGWKGLEPIHADDLTAFKRQLVAVAMKNTNEEISKLVALGQTSLATDMHMIAFSSRSSVYNLRLPKPALGLAADLFAKSEEIAVAVTEDDKMIRYTDLTYTLYSRLVELDIPAKVYAYGRLEYANQVMFDRALLHQAIKAIKHTECVMIKVTADPENGVVLEGMAETSTGKFYTVTTVTMPEAVPECPRFEFYVSPEKLNVALTGLKDAQFVNVRYDAQHVPMYVGAAGENGAFYVIARMIPKA